MIVDVIINEATAITITEESISFLLRDKDQVDIPVTVDGKEITIRFRKTKE